MNALLGRNAAQVDRLPVAAGIRYDYTLPSGQPVSILDTSGYGQDGPSDEDFAAAVEASRDADLIVLVTQATNPGRQPDVDLLDRLRAWFASKPHLKMPPVVVAGPVTDEHLALVREQAATLVAGIDAGVF